MAAAAAGAAAAVANAIKASGVVVRMEPHEFVRLLARIENPLVVVTEGGFFAPKHQYLTTYKGLAFHCRSDAPVEIPATAEVISASGMWIPA